MTPEEARALLDSAKGDERQALGAPPGARGVNDAPPPTYKNW